MDASLLLESHLKTLRLATFREQYRQVAVELPRSEPSLVANGQQDSWTSQFSQRVRKAGFVAGMVDSLVPDAHRLDSLWGVFEGSDASGLKNI